MQNTLEMLKQFKSERYLTTSLYLSLTPEERAARPPMYRTRLKTLVNQLSHWLDDHPVSAQARESVRKDFEQLEAYLEEPSHTLGENSLPVRGLAAFACSGEGMFQTVRLPYVERNTLVVDQTPYVRRLFAVEADFGVNLVVVFDNRDAYFYQVDIHGIQSLDAFSVIKDREVLPPGVHGVRTPSGLTAQHGMGERNVQMLKQHEQYQHLRKIADTILELRRVHPFDRLMIAAPDELANAFPGYLHDYVRRAYGGRIQAHDKMPINQIYERVLDRLTALDLEGEARLLSELHEATPALKAVGLPAVLRALEWGNVRTLLYDSEFTQPGAVFYPSGLIGLKPEDAPDGTVAVWQMPDILDTVLERALEQGAQVETVHGGARAQIQGASALLRYPMTEIL
ncbi:MAG: peptide chain release factor 1 [Fimbriimonadales bacterium]|nr:MAG: peptide chain release factor 1 [Fimbriimonadales bacterium]